ncbi:MAG: type III-A CRISPR-associated RAMP protein Csm4, partial [Oscillospiraceae bacterium]|nr:type III-A CRISPR-associated RAMP protein Csm4 [Oscillospiraceae bacterium]
FCADTLFSALCQDADNTAVIQEMVQAARNGQLAFSDTFPFDETALYLPKPCMAIRSDMPDDGNSVRKKRFKKLKYVPLEQYPAYLAGAMTDEQCENTVQSLKHLGAAALQTHVALPRSEGDEAEKSAPYNVGVYRFRSGCGLWMIVAADTPERMEMLTRRIQLLGNEGIGGRRSTGCGRFTVTTPELPEQLSQMLENGKDSVLKITISVSLPKEEELGCALEGASYQLLRRSGFVASQQFPSVKKNDVFVFQTGSCFRNGFSGDVYEVSDGGAHPVYRYAVPMFLHVR